MKRPMASLAVPFAAGIIAADYFSLPLWSLFLFSCIAAASAFCFTRLRIYTIGLLLCALGWIAATLDTRIISPNDLRHHFSGKPTLVTVRGTLTEIPRVRHSEDDHGNTRTRSHAIVRTKAVQTNDVWIPVHGEIQVTTYGALPTEFREGQEVEIYGALQPPPAPIIDGLFDYRSFLERQGIYFQLSASGASDWKTITSVEPGYNERFLRWAQTCLRRGLPEEDESLRLLYAMTLGWKTALDPETSERFMQSGTMHIFAISGLHIALIAGIILALLRTVRVPRQWCGLIAIPLLWFYTSATGWQPSAIRSSIMMTIVIVGWSLKRPGDLLNSLAAAALIILVLEPQQLFQASFQLSFFVVLSIALLMPPFEKLRERILKHDPFLPPELRPRWRKCLDLPIRFFTVSFITSVAAWVGSIPLSAHYFHLFTPVSLLANLVVVPLSSLALMANLGSLLSAPFSTFLNESFNHASWFFMSLMVWLSDKFTELPFAYWNVRGPSFLEFVAFYAIVFALCTGWLFRTRHKYWGFAVIGLFSGWWTFQFMADRNTYRITVMPLGSGDSIYVDAPGHSEDLLIDSGDQRSVQYLVQPFLRSQGVNRIPHLLLTHGDVRHVGGAIDVLNTFSVRNVYTSPLRFRSSPYRTLLQDLDSHGELRQELSRGTTLAGWQILHPGPDDKVSQADDGPLVLKKTIHKNTFLFLSDLGRTGQNLLLERFPELRADVVVSGLPREGEPLNNALIETLRPRLIVITDADFPATDRAASRLRERLNTNNIPILFTRDTGAVFFELTDKQFKWWPTIKSATTNNSLRIANATD